MPARPALPAIVTVGTGCATLLGKIDRLFSAEALTEFPPNAEASEIWVAIFRVASCRECVNYFIG